MTAATEVLGCSRTTSNTEIRAAGNNTDDTATVTKYYDV